MNKPLTAFEYFKLSRMLVRLEDLLKDPILRDRTNIEDIYETVVEQINYETDPILAKEVYSNPLILKPQSNDKSNKA